MRVVRARGLEKSRTLAASGMGEGVKGEDVSEIDHRSLHSNSHFSQLLVLCCMNRVLAVLVHSSVFIIDGKQ
jgi:hypothetical protein